MTPKIPIQISARRNVEERTVLARSADTVADAPDGVNERIGLLAVHLATNAADVDVNDIGRGIEMNVPHMLQQHRAGNNAIFVANEIFEQLKLARQQFDFPPAPADRSRDEIYLEITERWRNAPKPVIAEVQGSVIAGGLMLMWMCDIIVASEDARFRDNTGSQMGVPGVEFCRSAHRWT